MWQFLVIKETHYPVQGWKTHYPVRGWKIGVNDFYYLWKTQMGFFFIGVTIRIFYSKEHQFWKLLKQCYFSFFFCRFMNTNANKFFYMGLDSKYFSMWADNFLGLKFSNFNVQHISWSLGKKWKMVWSGLFMFCTVIVLWFCVMIVIQH